MLRDRIAVAPSPNIAEVARFIFEYTAFRHNCVGGQTRLRAFASHKTALGHIAFAAFCTLWYDEATRTAAFEPVGTHPEHQRTGLGKALMAEGLRRVRDLGATVCAAGSYAEASGVLDASLGFIEYAAFELTERTDENWFASKSFCRSQLMTKF